MRGGIRPRARALGIVLLGIAAGGSAACTPTVRVEPPKEPIVVNLNVKIEHEVRVRVEKDVEDLFSQNPDLF